MNENWKGTETDGLMIGMFYGYPSNLFLFLNKFVLFILKVPKVKGVTLSEHLCNKMNISMLLQLSQWMILNMMNLCGKGE